MAIVQNDYSEFTHYQKPETRIIDNQAVRFRDVCVHKVHLSDVEDPDLWVADPIWQWQQTPAGKFIMKHAEQPPYWIKTVDHNTYGYVYQVMARLSEHNETFWRLLCSHK